MELMDSRRALLDFDPPGTYGGIPIFADNCYFQNSSGRATDTAASEDWFIAGPFDSGDGSKKSYTFSMFPSAQFTTALRTFDDLSGACTDYWYNSTNLGGERTVSTAGRYILLSCRKDQVAACFVRQGSTYLIRGKGV